MEIKTKYCWVCGKRIPITDFDKHYDEHYKRKDIEIITISSLPKKKEKPFNPIKGLDKL